MTKQLFFFIALMIWLGRAELAMSDPDDSQSLAREHVRTGLAAHKAARYEEAIHHFNLAYALVPHPAILFNLGHSYRLLGDKATARSFYRKCSLAGEKGQIAQEARAWASRLDKEISEEEEAGAEQGAAPPSEAVQSLTENAYVDAAGDPSSDLRSDREREWIDQLRRIQWERIRREQSSLARLASATPDQQHAAVGDSNSTSSFLMPTALVPRRGTLSLHHQDLLTIGASYVPLRGVLATATMAPSTFEEGLVAALSAKAQVLYYERFHLALHGALVYERAGDSSLGGAIGGVATYCITFRCGSHASLYGGAGFVAGAWSNAQAVSTTVELFPRVKLLAEFDRGAFSHDQFGKGLGIFFWYGLRLTWPSFGVDVGMVKRLRFGELFMVKSTESEFGYPAVSFTYRVRSGS